MEKKKVREKSRECHNHKPQPFPDPKKKRKPTNPNKHKSNKRTKSTKISSLFPKRGNRNTKRTEKNKNKMTHGKTYNKSPRRINHKAGNLTTGNKILWKRGEIAPVEEQFLLFSTIFSIYIYFQITCSFLKCGYSIDLFLSSANLICRGTDIEVFQEEMTRADCICNSQHYATCF